MMKKSKFAPPERSSDRNILIDFETLSHNYCSKYFHHFSLPILVLNPRREIVFTNQAFLQMMGIVHIMDLIGQRPGEVMQCAYAHSEPGGCGTSEHCSECGAVQTVLESIESGQPSTNDCQLLQSIDGENRALDLRVHSSPFRVNGAQYYVVTIMNIEDEKKREVMERVFFHDILNSAGSAQNLINLLYDEVPEQQREILTLLSISVHGLIEEIQTHKEFQLAEAGDYHLSTMTLQSLEAIENISNEFQLHPTAIEKRIEVLHDSQNYPVKTDYSLLRRVLINMLKNGLEASPEGGIVKIGCRAENGDIVFEVHNAQVMDKPVQLQVFKRSFSTKGKGRGLGTYSIKLLAENYLGGKADFISNDKVGTIFRVHLPMPE